MNPSDTLPEVRSLCEAFQRTAAIEPTAVALRTVGSTIEITWAEYAARVRRIAAGLAALGVERGDTVALMMVNRPEFNLCDTAAIHLGAAPFSVYNTLPPGDIAHIFENAENRVVICEAQFVPRVQAAGGKVDHIVCIDDTPTGTSSLGDLEARGEGHVGFDFDRAWPAVGPEDLLTLIYTSGTTGPPKGVELTHANLLAELRATTVVLPVCRGDRILSYLPAAHIADRWSTHYQAIAFGLQITSVSDPTLLGPALAEVRPDVFGAVPRIWEKFKAAIESRLGQEPDPARRQAMLAAVPGQLGLDKARWLVSGAAPTSLDVLEFFEAAGLPICELWGMSEISACGTINPPGRAKLGTVGPALPGVELRLAADGELLCRGPQVMRGYRGEPAKTAEAINGDGWLHTGDVAEIDDDGYVRIVDRKKELIINAAGKNMSPANIEAKLKASSLLIGQAVAIGDRRPYNVALLVLDPDAAAAFARQHDLADASPAALCDHPVLRTAIEEAVCRANEQLARVEQVKAYAILPEEWQPSGDELTPTMKLKRRVIAEKYAAEVDALYAGG